MHKDIFCYTNSNIWNLHRNISLEKTKLLRKESLVKKFIILTGQSDTDLKIMNNNYLKIYPMHNDYISFIDEIKTKKSSYPFPYSDILSELKNHDSLCALIYHEVESQYKDYNTYWEQELKESAIKEFDEETNIINKILSRKMTFEEYDGFISGKTPLKFRQKLINTDYKKTEEIFNDYATFYERFPGISKREFPKRH